MFTRRLYQRVYTWLVALFWFISRWGCAHDPIEPSAFPVRERFSCASAHIWKRGPVYVIENSIGPALLVGPLMWQMQETWVSRTAWQFFEWRNTQVMRLQDPKGGQPRTRKWIAQGKCLFALTVDRMEPLAPEPASALTDN